MSPDTNFIVSGSGDKSVKVWDALTYEKRFSFEGKAKTNFISKLYIFQGHKNSIYSV